MTVLNSWDYSVKDAVLSNDDVSPAVGNDGQCSRHP